MPFGIIKSATDYIKKRNYTTNYYKKNRREQYYLIENEKTYFLKSPGSIQEITKKAYTINQAYKTLPKYLFFFPDTLIWGDYGVVINKNNYVFDEFSHNFNISTLRKAIFKPFYLFTIKIEYQRGTVATLLSPQSHNIYHWLFDVLARVRYYESVIHQIDYFFVSAKVPQQFLELLPLFGIPLTKIKKIHEQQKINIEYLYLSSLPGSEGRSSLSDIDYLTKKLSFNSGTEAINKRIYITRGNAKERFIVNEQELITIFKERDFNIVDSGTLTLVEQQSIFKNAELVIAYHGASLINLLFVPGTCKVLELFSPDYFRTDCYYNLASLRGLEYWYLLGKKKENFKWGDSYFDRELIVAMLDRLNIE